MSAILGSIWIAEIIKKIGRRYSIFLSTFCEGLAYILLAVCTTMESQSWYFVIAITARLIQGFGGAVLYSVFGSIVLNFFTTNTIKAFTLKEVPILIGVFAGPALGTLLFMRGGYAFMILTFGIILIVSAFFLQLLLPASLDLHTDRN